MGVLCETFYEDWTNVIRTRRRKLQHIKIYRQNVYLVAFNNAYIEVNIMKKHLFLGTGNDSPYRMWYE